MAQVFHSDLVSRNGQTKETMRLLGMSENCASFCVVGGSIPSSRCWRLVDGMVVVGSGVGFEKISVPYFVSCEKEGFVIIIHL